MNLSICFEEEGFSLAFLKHNSISYTCFYLFKSLNHKDQIQEIFSFFEEKKIFNQNFEKCLISFANDKQTLIPCEFYSEEKEEEFLQFSVSLSKDEVIWRNYIRSYNSYLIFSYRAEFEEVFKNKSSQIIIYHCASWFLNSIKPSLNENEMHLMVYLSKIDLAFISKGKLIFYNSFEYHCKEDLLYYILFVAQCLKVKIEDFCLIAGGKINHLHENYLFLVDYIPYINISNLSIKKIESKSEFDFHLTLFKCALSQEN